MQRQAARPIWAALTRGYAKKAAKGAPEVTAPKPTKKAAPGTAAGCNIYKEGSDPPLLADSDYPDWLWTMLDEKPTLTQLSKLNHLSEEVDIPTRQRYLKLLTRQQIKENNSLRSKS